MPGGMAGTKTVMSFIADQVSKNTYVNLMDQYRPCGKAHEVKGLETPVSETEFNQAAQEAKEAGISRFAAL
jgi:putative pyruvate formate lyase activating enzyme